jgi:CSLREA domain-containing protein
MSCVGRDYLKYAVLLIAAAFSTLPAFAATLTVTTLADDLTPNDGSVSLREAITAVNTGTNLGDPDIIAQNPGAFGLSDTINFSVTGTITLASALPAIIKDLTIIGPSAFLAVSGNTSFRVFTITSGTVFISSLTIENGNAGAGVFFGGGIDNDGTLTVTNSTISGNSALIAGGGINNFGLLTVTNSTISGNKAAGGGGIRNFGTLTVTNSTISGNTAGAGNGGGILNTSRATLKSTIVANSPSGGNCSGATITSTGYNLSDDSTCSLGFNQTGDLNNTPAGLDPNGLQDNGGPTKTIALLLGSPAVDAIPVAACTDQSIPTPLPVTTDQRGVLRPQGPGCDIGAYELIIPPGFAIRYASNLNIADSVVNITNTGASATGPIQQGPPNSQVNINGSICVNIYAFAADEQEVACCSCLVTPNGLYSASVKTALLNSTLTPSFPNEVVIKLLSTTPLTGTGGVQTCNPASPTSASLTSGLLAWGTTVHGVPTATGPTFSIAETPFIQATLTAAELARDVQECQFIQVLGSGQFGICKGCTNSGLGANAQ